MNLVYSKLLSFILKLSIVSFFFIHMMYESVFFQDVLVLCNIIHSISGATEYYEAISLEFGYCLPWYVKSDFLYTVFLNRLINRYYRYFNHIVRRNDFIKDQAYSLNLINKNTLCIKIRDLSVLDLIIKDFAFYNWHDIDAIYLDLQNIQDTYDYDGIFKVKQFIETLFGYEYYRLTIPEYNTLDRLLIDQKVPFYCNFKGIICIIVNYHKYSGNCAQLIDLVMTAKNTNIIIGNDITVIKNYLFYNTHDLTGSNTKIIYGVGKITSQWQKSYKATIVYNYD